MTRSISLRALDVAVALEVALRPAPTFASLSSSLRISASTAHESIQRLDASGLVRRRAEGLRANVAALEQFVCFGVRYAFPAVRGRRVQGVPTAHAAPTLSALLCGEVYPVVWEMAAGDTLGEAIAPLLPSAPAIVAQVPDLYELLAIVDVMRVGTARDREVATQLLQTRLCGT
jgi:DNA-binding Lrp family transcriptional regulator